MVVLLDITNVWQIALLCHHFLREVFFSQILLRNWATGKTNSVQVRAFPAPTELSVKSPISFSEPHRKQMNYIFIYSWDSCSSETQLETGKCQ